MFLMLVVAGTVYLLIGEALDAMMLLGFVVLVMGITIVQTQRSERALAALRDLSSPRALVLRDGSPRRIAGRDVVRGDMLIVSEGDRVAADGLLRRTRHLAVDESLLTGEPTPVRKLPTDATMPLPRPGGDDLSAVFSGTLVTAGQGVVEVVATGMHTELGRVGRCLDVIVREPTRLQRETRRIVRLLAKAGLVACAVAVVAYALTRGGDAGAWKRGFLAGIAMAMALLPEEFPVVLTIFLALGAWRLSKLNVLTRRMPAIEMLGAATVLCVDKTGTLTQNQMTLRKVIAAGHTADLLGLVSELPEGHQTLLEHAIRASKHNAVDPMERALHAERTRLVNRPTRPVDDRALLREYPLTPQILAVSHAWRTGADDRVIVSTKGAPEAVADLCHLPDDARSSFAREVQGLASQGLRVLAVARGQTREGLLPDLHHDLALELVGLVGFEDPLRLTVPTAVAECQAAGVRVVMITGDYPTTAQSIARQAGLTHVDAVITGPDLDRMSDEELAMRVRDVHVFARVVPEQKLRIVNALKANDEVVAMTGDGVNDAPALQSAHIGIAMGGRGTDVAREAAALVLLDDDFSSIVDAIRLGRRIYDNIRKAVVFVLAVHVPIAGLSMLPVFIADWPLLILPVHIAFLQLIIDPSCTLVFEAERAEPDVMRRPPRKRTDGLFSPATVRLALAQGFSILAMCLTTFLLARRHHSDDAARALSFVVLVVAMVVVILVNRSATQSALAMLRVPNAAVGAVLLGAGVFLTLALYMPLARSLFHFAPLDMPDLALALAGGVLCVLWFDGLKRTRGARSDVVNSRSS
jgi:Ca2+-transporting ATPase